MKKILITGGAGFIGSHLADYLISQGHEVTVLDNFSTGKNEVHGAKIIKESLPYTLIDQLVSDVDEVYHLAAAVGVRYCYDNPHIAFESNVLGTHNVLEACKKFKKPFLITSSSAVYGKIEKSEVDEDFDVKYGSPSKIEWFYSYVKSVEEALISWYAKNHSFPFKIVRLFNCVGRRQVGSYGMVVPRFVEFALNGQEMPVYGDGIQTRTFGDVRDIIKGLQLVMENGGPGEVYNLGGSDEVTIMDLARMIKEKVNSQSEIKLLPYEGVFRSGFEETLRRKPNLNKIKKLGYNPEFSLNETVDWIIEDFKNEK